MAYIHWRLMHIGGGIEYWLKYGNFLSFQTHYNRCIFDHLDEDMITL